MMNFIEGGVCAAQGFKAAGVHMGVKTHNTSKKDVALIVSDVECAAAAVFTKNAVKAAPIHVDKEHLKNGKARAIIVNSGNANACAPHGEENAKRMCAAAAQAIGCETEDVLVSSTGVIGQTINIALIENGIPGLYALLDSSAEASTSAAQAIMTTDTVKKEVAVETVVGGKRVVMGGLLETVGVSFNRISVDGDTSTNDSCMVLANGLAGNATITEKGEDYAAFLEALQTLCIKLAREMASDGEGAKHLITCTVKGAKSEAAAETIGKSVISSTLTKAAIFGADANWGRVLCAMGYSGEEFDPDKVDVHFASAAGDIAVCEQGRGLPFDETLAKKILTEHDVEINITMGEGEGVCTCWGCDITYDYIKINGDYRT